MSIEQMALFAQVQEGSGGSTGPIIAAISLGILLLAVAGLWKTFSKAGRPGWGAMIPFYNIYLWFKVAGRPGWWALLLLVPLVNMIVAIVVTIDVANRFGKGIGFGLGLLFLGILFLPILGFSNAQYLGKNTKLA